MLSSLVPHRKQLLGLVVLLLTATAGQLALTAVTRTLDVRHGTALSEVGKHVDTGSLWVASRALLSGQSARPWYGSQIDTSYAPPYAVLFAPFALLSLSLATLVSRSLASICASVALLWWGASTGRRLAEFWPVLLCLPVIEVFSLSQLPSAFGLLALTTAVFAQRRGQWLTVGVALALGSLRISNAIPIWTIVAVGIWWRPRALATTLAGVALVFIPTMGIAFVWDHVWPADYLVTLSYHRMFGPMALVQLAFGNAGAAVVTALQSVFCGLLVWRDRGGPISLDRAALALAATIFTTIVAGWYSAIYGIPALIRLSARPGFSPILWVVGFMPWLLVLLFTPELLGPDGQLVINFLTTLTPLFIAAAAFPLFRRVSDGQGFVAHEIH